MPDRTPFGWSWPDSERTERRNNVLNASGQLDLGSFKLDVGTVTEVVSVAAEGSTIETKNSDYSGLLTAKQIAQIQSRGRDVVNLLRLLPGVHYENDIEAMGDSFGSQIPNIGGQRKNWNQVTVDGLNGNELSGTNRMNSSINLDAIAEVKVLLNSYKAEFGHSGGANIQVVSKSGSTDYHGSAYWYGKRDAWNATPWENNRSRTREAEAPHRHARIQSRRPGEDSGRLRSGRRQETVLLLLVRGAAGAEARPDRACTGCRPRSSGRATSRRRSTPTAALIFVKDPSLVAAVQRDGRRRGCFPGNIIPANRSTATGSRC